MLRRVLTLAHRWIGLGMAGFLIPIGLTGSILVWRTSLDRWLNPDLYTVQSVGPMRTPRELAAGVAARHPGAHVYGIEIPPHAGASVLALVADWPGNTPQRRINEVFIDPVTGALLAARSTINPRLTRPEVMAWIYRFHYTLMMKRTGMVLVGVISILWLLDCFVGALLTVPRGATRWRKWKLAWQLRGSRAGYDIHRASGLWLWPVLAVLALSGVYLNLAYEVFVPVLQSLVSVLPASWQEPVATAVLEWQYPLHSGEAFGLAGRIIVCVAGVSVAVLAVTGVVISLRKLLPGRARVTRPLPGGSSAAVMIPELVNPQPR